MFTTPQSKKGSLLDSMTISIATFRIMTHITKITNATLISLGLSIVALETYAQGRYAERVSFLLIVDIKSIMLSVVIQSVNVLSVVILSAIMLSVVIPCHYAECRFTECQCAECRYAVLRFLKLFLKFYFNFSETSNFLSGKFYFNFLQLIFPIS